MVAVIPLKVFSFRTYTRSPAFLKLLETAKTEILLSRVLRLAIIPELQEPPGNDALVAAISFFEARKNHKGPIQVSKEDG